MIELLQLQNFQRHSKFQVKLDPHITVIVGPSDAGKSSIIRALYWVAFNHPSGISFIKDGSKGSCVTVKTSKDTIKRRRSKTVNHYEINGTKLEALKRGEVPDRVEDALRLNKINFQLQHDSPLWLSESAGQVAKNLNEIVNLELIDNVLASLSKQLRSITSEVAVCSNRLNLASKDRERLEWVSDAEASLLEIEEVEKELDEARKEETHLLAICTPLLAAVKVIKEVQAIIAPVTLQLQEIEECEQELSKSLTEMNSLAPIITKLEKDELFLSTAGDVVVELEEHLASIEGMNVKLSHSSKCLSDLSQLVQQADELNKDIKETEGKLKEAESELASVKVCPTCGKVLKT